MLRWTTSGAVAFPTTVQIRLHQQYEQRIQAGAPTPSRGLSKKECKENLFYFAKTLGGSRSTGCTALTLSGIQNDNLHDLPEILQYAQQVGIQFITLHIASELLSSLKSHGFQRIHLSFPTVRSMLNIPQTCIQRLHSVDVQFAASVLLSSENIPYTEAFGTDLIKVGFQSLSLVYPFPTDSHQGLDDPEIIAQQALQIYHNLRSDIRCQIKGLPACFLHGYATSKTSNRWYVDADHQRENALLFLPGVLHFFKADSCRFCQKNDSCDGFFKQHLRSHHHLKPFQ